MKTYSLPLSAASRTASRDCPISHKMRVYRVRCIPVHESGTDAERKAQAKGILETVFAKNNSLKNADAVFLSAAIEADGRHATALISADETKLVDRFSIHVEGTRSQIDIDQHFNGITTVVSPARTDVVYEIPSKTQIAQSANGESIVVVPGLAGHPYGSFKERSGSYMWITDYVPKQLPGARILLYGYKSDIVHGHVHLRISELGKMLRRVIELQDNMINVNNT